MGGEEEEGDRPLEIIRADLQASSRTGVLQARGHRLLLWLLVPCSSLPPSLPPSLPRPAPLLLPSLCLCSSLRLNCVSPGASSLAGRTAAGPAGFSKKGGGLGLSGLLAPASALLSNLPADSSESEEEDVRSGQSVGSKSFASAFSFKSASSTGSGGRMLGMGGGKSTGSLTFKPKLGIQSTVRKEGGGIGSLLEGEQWGSKTQVEEGQDDLDF